MKRVLSVVIFSAFAATAFAQSKPSSAPSKKQAPTQRIDITDGETAIGERQGPDSGRITVKPAVRFGKLIKVREDFNVEIVKSAHEL
jgi:hypothetical protein